MGLCTNAQAHKGRFVERRISVSSLWVLFYLGAIYAKEPQGGSSRKEQVHRLMVCLRSEYFLFGAEARETLLRNSLVFTTQYRLGNQLGYLYF